MCLAMPGKIIQLQEDDNVVVDYGGVEKNASSRLFPTVQVGDYVLVHAGFIIQQVTEADGIELMELNKEIGGLDVYQG